MYRCMVTLGLGINYASIMHGIIRIHKHLRNNYASIFISIIYILDHLEYLKLTTIDTDTVKSG